jgi:putative transposase
MLTLYRVSFQLLRISAVAQKIDTAWIILRAKVTEIFNTSQQSAASRSIMDKLYQTGENVGRYKVRRLMK